MSMSLVKMECPFTWRIDEQLSKKYDEKNQPSIGVDEEPLFALISSIMITYFRAVQGKNLEALENLETTNAIWKIFTTKDAMIDEASKAVLQHVMQATEYHVLCLLKRTSHANSLLKTLKDASSFQSHIQRATIEGCQAVAWTCFHEKGYIRATDHAKSAVFHDPKCPLWYYILSKNLRHARRNENNSFNPAVAERDAIIKCCQLSNVPFYKIHLAQMYRECQMTDKSKKMHLEILATNPKNPGILLKLARSFTAFEDFVRAKKCFDEAEKYHKSPMFYHYKGIFYEKQKDWEMAAKWFKKAAENGNFRADLQYSNAMSQLLKNEFDVVEHLTKMLDKYNDYPAYIQQIFLHIAMQYVFRRFDLKHALINFLKAIELNPQSEQLKDFSNSIIDWKKYDIYDLVSKKLREITNHHDEPSDDMINVILKLKEICDQHKNLQVAESFQNMKI